MLLVRCLAAACLLCAGCVLANMTPQSRFQDSAYLVNDAARWGSVDNALRHVAPPYAAPFTARHADWGRQFSIGEVDMVRMTMGGDHRSATSEVAVTWYDNHGVTVHNSVIEQQWRSTRTGDFQLIDEKIVSGDTQLFAQVEYVPPADPATAGSGAEAAPPATPSEPAKPSAATATN
jgi:hypothetical protein